LQNILYFSFEDKNKSKKSIYLIIKNMGKLKVFGENYLRYKNETPEFFPDRYSLPLLTKKMN